MKYFSPNPKHTGLHQFAVISIRAVSFCIWATLGLYLIAIGLTFSQVTLEPLLKTLWFKKVVSFASSLPNFPFIKHFLVTYLDHWYENPSAWWAMVVGFPLITIGLSVFFIGFFNLFNSIFDRFYNQNHCPFCKKPMEIVE